MADENIATLNVTIKVLQVGKKPMSQSFFKQLPYGRIIYYEEPELIVRPIGWVNSYWTKSFSNWVDFVYLEDSKLYRSTVLCEDGIDLAKRGFSEHFRPLGLKKPPDKEWLDRWDDIMGKLSEVDQLFIAV